MATELLEVHDLTERALGVRGVAEGVEALLERYRVAGTAVHGFPHNAVGLGATHTHTHTPTRRDTTHNHGTRQESTPSSHACGCNAGASTGAGVCRRARARNAWRDAAQSAAATHPLAQLL